MLLEFIQAENNIGTKISYGKSTLMMEAEEFSETLVHFYYATQCHIPESSTVHCHCHKNLKSHKCHMLVN
jgi:hypothetical protein